MVQVLEVEASSPSPPLPLPSPGEVLHELSNVIGAILLSSRSLLIEASLAEDVREDLEAIAARSEDGRDLLEALRRHLPPRPR